MTDRDSPGLRRQLSDARMGLRSDPSGADPIIVGYAAVFYRSDNPGTEYTLRRSSPVIVERIMNTAFTRAIAEDDVRALFNHDPSQLLGRVSSGTLKLSIDDNGLRYEIALPNTNTGCQVASATRRGDLTGSSFGFRDLKTVWREEVDGDSVTIVRELHDVRLFDVGPTTFPAYPATTAATRAVVADEAEELLREYEAWKSQNRQNAVRPLAARLAALRARACEVG